MQDCMQVVQWQCVPVAPAPTAAAEHLYTRQNHALQKHNARMRSYASDAIGVYVCDASANLLHQLC